LNKKQEKTTSVELLYALKYVKETFSEDDIKNGIFGDKKLKTQSKTQKPFDNQKTEMVKSKY
jgi:hypothetical protein